MSANHRVEVGEDVEVNLLSDLSEKADSAAEAFVFVFFDADDFEVCRRVDENLLYALRRQHHESRIWILAGGAIDDGNCHRHVAESR